jgi:hypothetical protein
LRCLHLLGHFRQHGDAAGNVEAADADRQTGSQEGPGQVDGAWELIGLHADKTDQRLAAGLADHADNAVGPHPPVRLIVGMQLHLDAGAEHLAATRVLGQPIQAGEGVGRDRRAEPLNRIAVVVIVRRLDNHEMEQARISMAAAYGHNLTAPSFTRDRPAKE